MGCNQSKAASDAVLADGGKIISPPTGVKMSSSTSPSSRGGITNPCSSGEGAELTANGTLSSDDHDVLAVLSNDASTPKSDAASKTDNADIEESPPQEAPTSPVLKEAPSDEQVASSSQKDDAPTTNTVTGTKSPQSPKSPRRRRRRSNSGGVKAMQELAAVQDEEEEEARQQVHVQPALQPVVAKNFEKSIVENEVEATITSQPKEEKVPSDSPSSKDNLVEETAETGDLTPTVKTAEVVDAKIEEEKVPSDTITSSPDISVEKKEIETGDIPPTEPNTEDSNANPVAVEEAPQPPAESEAQETAQINGDDVPPKSTTTLTTVENNEVSLKNESGDEVSMPTEDANLGEIEVEQTDKSEEEFPKATEETEPSPSTPSEIIVEPVKMENLSNLETTTPKKEKTDICEEESSEERAPSPPRTPTDTVVEPTKMKELSDVETITPKKEKICAGCFVPEAECGGTPFKFCARCKAVAYCGRDCQINHWKQHKKVCGSSSVTKDIGSSSRSSIHLTTGEALGQPSPSNSSSASTSNTEELFRDHFLHETPSSSSRASIHEEAVKELEAVLRRLRSNDPEFHNNVDDDQNEDVDDINKSLEEINISLKSPSPMKSDISELDPIDGARELAALQSPPTLPPVPDVNTTMSPLPSSPRPFDENTPILLPHIRRCAGCNTIEKASGAFKDCAKCRAVFYCNKKCQKGHWKEHKKTCCKTDSRMSLLGSKELVQG